jgi:hypothetical protein
MAIWWDMAIPHWMLAEVPRPFPGSPTGTLPGSPASSGSPAAWQGTRGTQGTLAGWGWWTFGDTWWCHLTLGICRGLWWLGRCRKKTMVEFDHVELEIISSFCCLWFNFASFRYVSGWSWQQVSWVFSWVFFQTQLRRCTQFRGHFHRLMLHDDFPILVFTYILIYIDIYCKSAESAQKWGAP